MTLAMGDRHLAVKDCVLPHEHTQSVQEYIFRASMHQYSFRRQLPVNTAQSGQSLIEHSYRADSDLSPSGWAYAEKLKGFVTQKYTKSLSDRGIDGKSRRLVVRRTCNGRPCH